MYETLILYIIFALVEFSSLLIAGIFLFPKKIIKLSTKLKWYFCSLGILPLYLYPVYFMFIPFNLSTTVFVLVLVIYLVTCLALYTLFNKVKSLFIDYYQSIHDEQTCQKRLKTLNNIKTPFIVGIFVFIFLFYYGGYINILLL